MKRGVSKCFKKAMEKKNVCFVLITCEAPSDDGRMQVEMTYEGDEALAAYLLLGAHDFIEEESMCVEPLLKENKIHYLKN